jgi:hypothetical protein
MADKEIEFVDGLIVKAPHENAPDYVKANISIKVEDLGKWLRGKYKAGDQWVNLDVKVAKSGKWYASVSNFKPKQPDSTRKIEPKTGHPVADIDSDIPFSPIRNLEATCR